MPVAQCPLRGFQRRRLVQHKAIRLLSYCKIFCAGACCPDNEYLGRLRRADHIIPVDQLSGPGAGELNREVGGPDGVSRERRLRTPPADRLLDGPPHLGVACAAFDEERLCALVDRLACNLLVLKPAQDNDGDLRNNSNDLP